MTAASSRLRQLSRSKSVLEIVAGKILRKRSQPRRQPAQQVLETAPIAVLGGPDQFARVRQLHRAKQPYDDAPLGAPARVVRVIVRQPFDMLAQARELKSSRPRV